ncbi:hypothetical protein B0H66DRAFT_133673 [Apodospora peruviana]|uniref:Uncharacterized protein n=1 Tax=Apodospora peruviana TaxID=516989 RepID=A0AAE0MAQ1_9PEZI|nr:hypothetical protein B0H66DRAFT_133673 [Apodospora peruviana]
MKGQSVRESAGAVLEGWRKWVVGKGKRKFILVISEFLISFSFLASCVHLVCFLLSFLFVHVSRCLPHCLFVFIFGSTLLGVFA